MDDLHEIKNQIKEIHAALIGNFDKEGMISKLERHDYKITKHDKIIKRHEKYVWMIAGGYLLLMFLLIYWPKIEELL